MTCEEFRHTFFHVDPFGCTVALRAAVFRHCIDCPACLKMSQSYRASVSLSKKLRVQSQLASDVQDAEFRQTVLGDPQA